MTEQRIARLDWDKIRAGLDENGFAQVSGILTAEQCDALAKGYERHDLYRKVINMERYRFGRGEYKYFNYPLPALIGQIRQSVYPFLAPLANNWMNALGIHRTFPDDHAGLIEQCRFNEQTRPTPLILRYGAGGYNALHQDIYGEIFFPIQLVIFLSTPGKDYQGGEFVLIEQRPRAQSKAIVLQGLKGDMLLFATRFRPVKGLKGHYRVNIKHGVSEITAGGRHTLGVIFHDAQ